MEGEGERERERESVCDDVMLRCCDFRPCQPSEDLVMGQSGTNCLLGVESYDTAVSLWVICRPYLGLLLHATIDKNILGAADGLLPLPTPLSSG